MSISLELDQVKSVLHMIPHEVHVSSYYSDMHCNVDDLVVGKTGYLVLQKKNELWKCLSVKRENLRRSLPLSSHFFTFFPVCEAQNLFSVDAWETGESKVRISHWELSKTDSTCSSETLKGIQTLEESINAIWKSLKFSSTDQK